MALERVTFRSRYAHTGEIKRFQGRFLLFTSQGGAVAVDARVAKVWRFANGHTLDEIIGHFPGWSANEARSAVACLVASGLLTREGSSTSASVADTPPAMDARVSVVIVAYNSRDWLAECLPSLDAQTCPPLETIVVDNGSQDDALVWLAGHYPRVQTISMNPPGPLAAAINTGVRASSGDYILLLNPDVRLAPDAIAHMVQVAKNSRDVAAVAPKLRFWWAPAFLNGIGNRLPRLGFGTDNALGHLDLGQFDLWEAVPSACFAATLIPRAAWEAVGLLDEGFPMYYEDLEWSYRARMLGWQVLAAPQAVVYHAFGGRIPSPKVTALNTSKLQNVLYGRRRLIWKLAGSMRWKYSFLYTLDDFARLFWAAVHRDWTSMQAMFRAWLRIWRERASLNLLRRALQARRVVDDQTLFAAHQTMPPTLMWHGFPELTWDIIQSRYLPWMRTQKKLPEFQIAHTKTRLLILSHEIVGDKMAGPGMRYLEMARALQDETLTVTLAVPQGSATNISDLLLVAYRENDPKTVQRLAMEHDVVLVAGYLLNKFPFLAQSPARLVVDLYDPLVLENLHYDQDQPLAVRQMRTRQTVDLTNRLARLGDFFICGNERQRDFWLGVLAANGRINPQTYAQDASLRALIDVVGIGFPAHPPRAGKPFLRGVHPQIPEDARIVLWGGGIWNWLDPLTLVRAWPQVVRRFPKARLVFLGTRHPNPTVPQHEMAAKTIALAAEIGEKDRTIVVLEWVDYRDRERLLLEADVGVTLHPIHIETRYSARTRVLDYLWARLPVLITEGDVTSEWVAAYGLGRVVPEADPEAVAAALEDLLAQPKEARAAAFAPLLERFTWPQVVAPLRQYCLHGHFAPDRLERDQGDANRPVENRWQQALILWRAQGTRVFLHRVWRYVRWRLS